MTEGCPCYENVSHACHCTYHFAKCFKKKERPALAGLSDVTPAGGKEELQRVTNRNSQKSGKIEVVPHLYLRIDSGLLQRRQVAAIFSIEQVIDSQVHLPSLKP